MTRYRNFLMWVFVVLVTVPLQVKFVFMEMKSTPSRTVIAFSKAYFLFDSSMADYFSYDVIVDDHKNVVDNYLLDSFEEASNIGFESHFIRQRLSHIKTETISGDARFAKVKMTAIAKTYINPLFAWVAQLFSLGEEKKISEIFDLIKEGTEWKLSKLPFGLG